MKKDYIGLQKALSWKEQTPFYSAVVVVSPDRKKFLIGKRKEDNIYTSPAGGAKLGETPKQTAIRECFEESGIRLTPGQLKELPITNLKDGKVCHCFVAVLKELQDAHTRHDPDKEVWSWRWLPITSRLPEPIDENRANSFVEAKMWLMNIKKALAESEVAGVNIDTTNHAIEDMATKDNLWTDHIKTMLGDFKPGDLPREVRLKWPHILIATQPDEGIYDGYVKNMDEESGDFGMVKFQIKKLTLPAMVEALKAKGFIEEVKVATPPPEGPKEESDAHGIGELLDILRDLKRDNHTGDININLYKGVDIGLAYLYKTLTKARTPGAKDKKPRKRRLVHFSPEVGLKTIDPAAGGSNIDARTKGREMHPEAKYNFYYNEGGATEDFVTQNAKSKYTVELPEDHKIYNASADEEKHAQAVRDANDGAFNMAEFSKRVKAAGYHGFEVPAHPQDFNANAVMLFNPQNVSAEEKASKEDKENIVKAAPPVGGGGGNKRAQIGEVRTHRDGKKYRKEAEGKWVEVTDPKNKLPDDEHDHIEAYGEPDQKEKKHHMKELLRRLKERGFDKEKIKSAMQTQGRDPSKVDEHWEHDAPHEGATHHEVSAEAFYNALQQARESNEKIKDFVHVYSQEELKEMKVYLNPDGKSGYAVKKDGDIVSVFSSEKGRGDTIIQEAIKNGGHKLDAFDGYLTQDYYPKHGFVEYKREENWDGPENPDVVYMALKDSPALVAQEDEGKPNNNMSEQKFNKPGHTVTREDVDDFIKSFHNDFKAIHEMMDSFKAGGLAHSAAQRLKATESLLEKMNVRKTNRSLNTMTDVIGARTISDTVEQQMKVLDHIKKNFEIVEEENFVDKGREGGYRAVHILFKTPGGKIAELQIKTNRQQLMSKYMHDTIYKPPKDAPEELKNALKGPEVKEFTEKLSNWLHQKDLGRNPGAPPKEPKILTENGINFPWDQVDSKIEKSQEESMGIEKDPSSEEKDEMVKDDIKQGVQEAREKLFFLVKRNKMKQIQGIEEFMSLEEAWDAKQKAKGQDPHGEFPIGSSPSKDEFLRTFNEYEQDSGIKKPGGPGSRGGKVVGTDAQGRPIYASSKIRKAQDLLAALKKD